MNLIVFAHPLEAKAALEAVQATEVELGRLWRYEGGTIVVTGMGSAAAAACVGRYSSRASHITNIGFAGSLGTHEIGEVIEVGECTKHIPIPDNSPGHCRKMADKGHPPLAIGSGARLITSDYPVHSKEERAKLAEYDLVDMEGYGIALAAKRADLPCTMWKVVSDSCKEGGWEAITAHLETLQERIVSLLTCVSGFSP